MAEIASSVVTAALMLLMLRAAATLVDPRSALADRTVPWAAVVLTGLAVVGLVVQATWTDAMAALDDDPSRTGWWRPFTAVFLQNSGVAGTVWNLVTLALVAAAACLWWGDVLTVLLFAAGALLPGLVDGVVGTLLRALPGAWGADAVATAAADPRNFVGSSGATYFLAATLAAAVVLHRPATVRERVLAGFVPVLGGVAFVVVDDAHGLVTAEGLVDRHDDALGLDVAVEPELVEQGTGGLRVVAGVQVQAHLVGQVEPEPGQAFEGGAQQHRVVPVRAVDHAAERDPLPVGEPGPLDPELSAVYRGFPGCLPAARGLGDLPVDGHVGKVQAHDTVVGVEHDLLQRGEHAGGDPLVAPRADRGGRDGGVSVLDVRAAEHQLGDELVEDDPVGHARAMTAQRVGVHDGRDQGLELDPQRFDERRWHRRHQDSLFDVDLDTPHQTGHLVPASLSTLVRPPIRAIS